MKEVRVYQRPKGPKLTQKGPLISFIKEQNYLQKFNKKFLSYHITITCATCKKK